MPKILEKVERRLGEKLMLKGDRCMGPKCAMVRRAYPPGVHGKNRSRRRGGSEFASLLHTKQVVRFSYGLDDADIERYSRKAAARSGIFSSNFLQSLESRLDNVVFRLGFADSRRSARQLVNHGHIALNDKRATVPSISVKKGDRITFYGRSRDAAFVIARNERLKKVVLPQWLSLNPEKKEGSVIRLPEVEDVQIIADITKIKEFYSR